MLQFTHHTLERLTFVIETKGKNPQVIQHLQGLESMMVMGILQKRVKLTKSRVCRVFGEDNSYRGYMILNERGFPQKILENNYLTFEDFYQVSKA